MQATPVTATPSATPPATSLGDTATSAFGLSFESLLKIVLTQLTYQDPLKPMDNYQFVSQLAQFSQIQQGQTISDSLQTLVAAQGTVQATGLLGKVVDIPSGATTLSGTVTGVAFNNGTPSITIETTDNQTISNIAISSITQVREGE